MLAVRDLHPYQLFESNDGDLATLKTDIREKMYLVLRGLYRRR